MKTFKFTLIITALLFVNNLANAQKNNYSQRGYVSPNYTIHFLTMDLVQKYNLEGKDEVELSSKYLEMITKSFAAISKSENSGRGRVMPYNSLNQVQLEVKTEQFWKDKTIKNLLKKHGLKYKKRGFEADSKDYLIYRKKDFNVKALTQILRKHPQVKSAYVASTGIMGSGSRVRLKLEGNRLKVSFGHGFGDCPAGCIHWSYKHYEVDTKTYAVKFLGKTGKNPLDKVKPPKKKKN